MKQVLVNSREAFCCTMNCPQLQQKYQKHSTAAIHLI